MNTRVALALILFFGCALANVVPIGSIGSADSVQPRPTPPISPVRVVGPAPMDLPNDCVIVASEAASRLIATGAWTRVLLIRFFDARENRTYQHAFCVWQPPTAKVICIYDWHGTIELGTELHDYNHIAAAFCRRAKVRLVEAHFLQ